MKLPFLLETALDIIQIKIPKMAEMKEVVNSISSVTAAQLSSAEKRCFEQNFEM